MNQKTEPVFKLILFFGFFGILLTLWGLADRRDIIALAGTILIATCMSAIARPLLNS